MEQLADLLTLKGYTVFRYPNEEHLDAEPPEDHTYYSETGWPKLSPYGWRHAIDIMPPPNGSGLWTLTQLGARIYADRQEGQITWLKYMNWPSTGDLSHATEDRWEPDHSWFASGDIGHIHLSSVTGVETLDSPYDPFQSGATDMNLTDTVPGSGTPDTGGKDRTVAQILADVAKLRAVLKGDILPSVAGFAPTTPLAIHLAGGSAVTAAQMATLESDLKTAITAAVTQALTTAGTDAVPLRPADVETAVEAGVRAVLHGA